MAEIPHDIRFALDEFDRDQLPESQRGLRGEAFQEAVREYLTERFAAASVRKKTGFGMGERGVSPEGRRIYR